VPHRRQLVNSKTGMSVSTSGRAFLTCTHVPSDKTNDIHLEHDGNRPLTVSEVDMAVRNNLLKVYLSKDKYRDLAAYLDSLRLRKVCLWTILVYAFATVAETSICITSRMTLQDKMKYLKLIMTLFNVLEQYKVSYCAGDGKVIEWGMKASLPSNAEYLKYCNKLSKLKESAEDGDEEGIDITHTDNEEDSDSSDDEDSQSSDKDSDNDSSDNDSSDNEGSVKDSDSSDKEEEAAEDEISLLPVNSSVEHEDRKDGTGKKHKAPEEDKEGSLDESSESEEEAESIEPVTLGKRRRG